MWGNVIPGYFIWAYCLPHNTIFGKWESVASVLCIWWLIQLRKVSLSCSLVLFCLAYGPPNCIHYAIVCQVVLWVVLLDVLRNMIVVVVPWASSSLGTRPWPGNETGLQRWMGFVPWVQFNILLPRAKKEGIHWMVQSIQMQKPTMGNLYQKGFDKTTVVIKASLYPTEHGCTCKLCVHG